MQPKQIERLLPGVFQRVVREGGPLVALLEVMSALHEPSEAALSNLAANLNPRRCTDAFVPFLAKWVDLDLVVTTGLGRLRELVAAAVELSKWRGTEKGLLRFLETATGTKGFTVNEQVRAANGSLRPFHVQVAAPNEVKPYVLTLRQIIELEKPAYVTYDLIFVEPS